MVTAGVKDIADAKLAIDELVVAFKSLHKIERDQVIKIKTEDLQKSLRKVQQSTYELGTAFTPSLAQGTKAAAKFRADFTAEVKGIVADTSLSSEKMRNALFDLIDSWIDSGRATESNRDKLIDLVKTIVKASGNVAGLRQEIDALTNAQTAAASGVGAVVDELDRYREAYNKFLKEFATPDERFQDARKQWREALGPLFNDDADKRLRSRYLPKPAKPQDSELQNFIKRLQEQRATLGMTADEAERYRIEQAKGSQTHRVRALALFDEVQAWKQAEEATRKAAESARYFATVEREIDLYRQERDIEVASIGLSDRQRELMEQELTIRQEYAERRRQLEEAQQVESTRLAESAYQARIEALRSAEDQQVQILQESAARKRQAEQSWLSGAKRGLENYADHVMNIAGAVENLVTKAFGGMEDALSHFVTTGKLDFRGLADSIIKDMIRIAIQQSVTGVLAHTFGGWLGGIGGSGVSAGGFSSGGYTGDGGKFEPAGIVHKGEGVLNQDEIRAIGGEAGFYDLRRAIRGQGHATGGMAGRPSLPPPSAQGSAANVQVTVNVSDTGIQANAPPGWGDLAQKLGGYVKREVHEQLMKSHRQGGLTWQARQGALA